MARKYIGSNCRVVSACFAALTCIGSLSAADDASAEQSGLGSAGARGARWQQGSVRIDVEGSVDLLGNSGFDAVVAAASAWQEGPGELPVMVVAPGPESTVGYNRNGKNQNSVRYSPDGDPLANGALAITVITFDAQAKQILDADIILNGEHQFGFFDGTENEPGSVYDLQNVLTHEMGHLLGLGEEFEDESATMYAFSQPGEIEKRDLNALDAEQIAQLYDEPFSPEESAGCGGATIAGHSSSWSWAALGLGLMIFLVRRRSLRSAQLTGLALLMVGAATSGSPSSDVFTVEDSESRWEGGVIVTELSLRGQEGQPLSVQVLGGQVGDVVQQVGRVMPPQPGDALRLRQPRWLDASAYLQSMNASAREN